MSEELAYQSWEVPGGWYLNIVGFEYTLNSEAEAITFMNKLQVAKDMAKLAQSLETLVLNADIMHNTYWQVVTAQGVFTNEELAPIGLTVANVEALDTMMTQFQLWIDGGVNTPVDHMPIFISVRKGSF